MPEAMRGRDLLRHLALPEAERYLDALTLFRREDKQQLFRKEAFEQFPPDEPYRLEAEALLPREDHWLTRLQSLDLKGYLPLDIVPQVDRMHMAPQIYTPD